MPAKSISWCHLILMKKNAIVFWGQYPGNFETKFFPLRFEGTLYNSVREQLLIESRLLIQLFASYQQDSLDPWCLNLAVAVEQAKWVGQVELCYIPYWYLLSCDWKKRYFKFWLPRGDLCIAPHVNCSFQCHCCFSGL